MSIATGAHTNALNHLVSSIVRPDHKTQCPVIASPKHVPLIIKMMGLEESKISHISATV
jgi:hypothetical protein